MTTAAWLRLYRPFLMMPLLIIGFWSFSQKGCVPDPDLKPTPALAVAATPLAPNVPPVEDPSNQGYLAGPDTPQSSGNTAQSLLRAANLLNQAASLIDKNERMAVQFIREAIAILKHDVIHALNAPEADKVSVAPTERRMDQPL